MEFDLNKIKDMLRNSALFAGIAYLGSSVWVAAMTAFHASNLVPVGAVAIATTFGGLYGLLK